MKRFSYWVVFVVLSVLLAAPIAFGQALDNQWLQLKVSFKGYAYGLGKASISTTNFMFITWDAVDSVYNFTLYQPDGTQIIQRGDSFFPPDILSDVEVAIDVGIGVSITDGVNNVAVGVAIGSVTVLSLV
jgi:hypothetical protein